MLHERREWEGEVLELRPAVRSAAALRHGESRPGCWKKYLRMAEFIC